MKKLIALALSLVCALGLFGCSSVDVEKGLHLRQDNVKIISVTSLPEGYEYSFSGDDAKDVVDYFAELNLTPYSDVIDETGMAWVISIEYENGDITRVIHSCNKFIRTDDSPWYQMTYEEANRFNTLLDELNK